MATPSSGEITFSQIAAIVYNNGSTAVTLNDSDVRKLLGVGTDGATITMQNAYSKPMANTYPYDPGSYTLIVPAYQNMTWDVRAGGQGGNGGTGSGSCTGWCGVYCWFPYCCNGSGGGAGGDGTRSDVSGTGLTTAYAAPGTSSAAGGGSGGTVTTGGGGAGGWPTNNSGGSGGRGVVILRYSTTYGQAASTTGSPTYTSSGGYHIYTYNATGSITW